MRSTASTCRRAKQEVLAAIVARKDADASLTDNEMRQQLAPLLARFEIPRYLRVVDGFPVTPSGKIQKFRLRELFAAEQGS